jgi:hypothetical protein
MLAAYEKRLGRKLNTPAARAEAEAGKPASKPAASKYHNVKVATADGVFDSKREAERWKHLKEGEALGFITNLIRQVTFELAPKVKQEGSARATPAMRYKADFIYVEHGQLVVEDVKGMKTRTYLMKKHLMATIHGITIKET